MALETQGVPTTIVGTLINFRRGGGHTFLILRDPEDRKIRIQAVQQNNDKTEFRLGDVLLLEVLVSAEQRAPEGLSFDVKKVVVVYRPPLPMHLWRQLRFIWWNRHNLQVAFAANR